MSENKPYGILRIRRLQRKSPPFLSEAVADPMFHEVVLDCSKVKIRVGSGRMEARADLASIEIPDPSDQFLK